MKPSCRIIEPECELELHDDEHILIRMKRNGHQPIEIVLEDAALKDLSRRRVTLRFNEAHTFHEESLLERVARELREQGNGIEPNIDDVLEEIRRRRVKP